MIESKYLIFVDANANHNKFYEATLNDDYSIDVKYGRVGNVPTIHHYNRGEKIFSTLIDSKLRKGYVERTALHVTQPSKSVASNKKIEDPEIDSLVNEFIRRARQFVSNNYTVSYEAITEKMIKEAQQDIDTLNELVNNGCSLYQFNNTLMEVFKDVPRRMTQVSDFLAKTTDDFCKIIDREQDMLDNLRGQVTIIKSTGSGKAQTVLEENGINMEYTTYDEDDYILDKLTKKNWEGKSNENKYVRAFKISNAETEKNFNEYCKDHNLTPHHGRHFYFHGTKFENLWSIMRTGLQLHPNASITGKAFGQGIYFAKHSQKSLGYTSLQGARWTTGSKDTTGILLMYEVATGNSYITKNTLRGGFTIKDLERLGNYQSVYAPPGVFRNSEVMVYNQNQCTIRYAVEVSGYAKSYTIDYNDRKKLRFTDALGKLRKSKDGYRTDIMYNSLSDDAARVLDSITNGESKTIYYNPKDDSIDILDKNGQSTLNNELTGPDKAWIMRQFKREFACNDKAFKKLIEGKEKIKEREKE